MNQIVVDTDVASYLFNWHPDAPRYTQMLRGFHLSLSFMSVAELRMGTFLAQWGERRRLLLEDFIDQFKVIYADDALCTRWGRVRTRARKSGHEVSPQDAWIAATALGLNVPLATNNVRDYAHIPDLQLLTL